MHIVIVGAGVAGLASAIAISKWVDGPTVLEITLLEIRSQPSTIGGAIGLSPTALRCLHHLGALDVIRDRKLGATIDKIELFDIYSAGRLGEIDFLGPDGQGIGSPALKGLRIMRQDLLQALLTLVKGLPNVKVEYGRKMTHIEPFTPDNTLPTGASQANKITLDTGEQFSYDLLLGCDGIHSTVRALWVEPARSPTYTGIAAVFGFSDLSNSSAGDDQSYRLPWKQTGLSQSRRGTLMSSHYEPTRTKQFVAVIKETADVESRDGWKALGAQQAVIREEILQRYADGALPPFRRLVETTKDWTLYPVYALPPKGRWSRGNVMLLGDAAHAMPPQGESTGIALEDAILFARVLATRYNGTSSPSSTPSSPPSSSPVEPLDQILAWTFQKYEDLRRPAVDKAYDQAAFGWSTQKDSGWVAFYLRNWLTWVFLWWTAKARRLGYEEDVGTVDIDP